MSRLQATASLLYANAASSPTPAGRCLGADEIAALSEGKGGRPEEASVIHLAGCGDCRRRLAAVTRLLRDDALTPELRRLGAAAPRAFHRIALRSVAAAAAVAAVLAGAVRLRLENSSPIVAVPDAGRHRESALTTTVAPRIAGPSRAASTADSLRWTSVPHADRYQVMVFDREGTLVWSPQTGDTTLALPQRLSRGKPTTYLWKVEARTSWDRWVASEWDHFTIDPTGSSR